MQCDTIDNYFGREALWVALCAFDGVQNADDEEFTVSDATTLIESVWEFCEEFGKEAGAIMPSKDEAVRLLEGMIETWKTENE